MAFVLIIFQVLIGRVLGLREIGELKLANMNCPSSHIYPRLLLFYALVRIYQGNIVLHIEIKCIATYFHEMTASSIIAKSSKETKSK